MDSRRNTSVQTIRPLTLLERAQNHQKTLNEDPPEAIHVCAHELIQAQTNQHPDLPTIRSCEINLSSFLYP